MKWRLWLHRLLDLSVQYKKKGQLQLHITSRESVEDL